MVLLPEPFGPSSPTTSPSATENDTSRTARRGPYHLTRFCTSTTGALIYSLSEFYPRVTHSYPGHSMSGASTYVSPFACSHFSYDLMRLATAYAAEMTSSRSI